MTTIADLRTTYLNTYLGRADADVLPWTSTECDRHLTDALTGLYPGIAKLVTGTVATNGSASEYAVPAGVDRISRIDLLDSSGVDLLRVTNWRYSTAGYVTILPLIASGYTLRFTGWAAYATDGSDLPARLEDVVAKLAAAQAYGELAAALTNSENQQTLDEGRVVDHQQAIALSAYWQSVAQSRLTDDPARASYAPRRARR